MEYYTENQRLNTPSFFIIQDIIKFLIIHKYMDIDTPTLKEELYYAYMMGLISSCEYDVVENEFNRKSKIHKIEVEGSYIIISFNFISMMVCQDFVEDFLSKKWLDVRLAFNWFSKFPYLDILKENKLGIKIKGFAGIGGENYMKTYATMYTPEEIQTMFKDDPKD